MQIRILTIPSSYLMTPLANYSLLAQVKMVMSLEHVRNTWKCLVYVWHFYIHVWCDPGFNSTMHHPKHSNTKQDWGYHKAWRLKVWIQNSIHILMLKCILFVFEIKKWNPCGTRASPVKLFRELKFHAEMFAFMSITPLSVFMSGRSRCSFYGVEKPSISFYGTKEQCVVVLAI